MISSFRSFLIEEDKTVYFTFGRMNPPTIGHEKLMKAADKVALGGPLKIYPSRTQDSKKNPISCDTSTSPHLQNQVLH